MRHQNEDAEGIGLEWQLQRVGGKPLTHKPTLKADGQHRYAPLPPIVLTALKLARQHQAQVRTDDWPEKCICGESHSLVLTTRNGNPIEPRNINRAFDIRRACRSAPDHHPRHAARRRPRPPPTRMRPWPSPGTAGPGTRRRTAPRCPAR